MLKPYLAKGTIWSHSWRTLSLGKPWSTAPRMKFSPSRSIMSWIFLPIALRSVSAFAIEKPAISTAIRITCSW